ncbi:hypothetical protein Pcinc_016828 [Petrolisthes cinctipes]|uniref:C2H2-type domain-containing protein n=1 Tax=Petrolisthes cinctipes TaxID=88211 RepID=A0AAE1FS08_PETCI|nr:hypothetical protein Pcinc_016828 [Petrolisthes cinctipes]
MAPWRGTHTCPDCNKTFTQKISLSVHRMFKHGAPRRYRCPQCTYQAPTKEYLKRHMRVHTNERQYVCPHCGKGLKTAESYRNHLVIHTGEGRFVCPVCHKAYNHKGAYHDHLRTHRPRRDYACDYCGAAFKAYKQVAQHIRAVHLNDKRFVCDVCGSRHMTSFNLKGHMKKHGDLSSVPYSHVCPACHTEFRGSEGLTAHMRVVHTTVPHTHTDTDTDNISSPPVTSIITPHPTRRPVHYHYSKVLSNVTTTTADNNNDDIINNTTQQNIYVEDDNYSLGEGYEENEVYELYCPTLQDDDEEDDEDDEEDDDDDEEGVVDDDDNDDDKSEGGKVIHVYPCSECHIMFTAPLALKTHTCKPQQHTVKEEPISP